MIKEFRSFLVKSNALALAIGVIIGAALGTVVKSLVDDIIMPPIGLVLGGIDFSSLTITLQQASGDKAEVAIRYGVFINALIAFIIIAFVAFWLGRMFMREEAPAPTKTCPFCKEGNAVDATKCRACTSAI